MDGSHKLRQPQERIAPLSFHRHEAYFGLDLRAMFRNSLGPLVLLNLTLNAQRHKTILENDLRPQIWAKLLMGRRVRLANGGTALVPGWFKANRVQVVSAPPYSPDLNVIENLWAFVKSKLKGKPFGSKVELWYLIRRVWATIGPQILRDLADSMPRRIQAVIAVRGGPTKY
ncbi:unnamed protein product, partial [Mesorhabditis belari]|uniref:Tc1-like transposase DDE domain-containing protein n=1 Tax=Mesorhabditis belari TaxID=2138241 RepID=A0AAF3FB26_9BILA